ncbi:MAG: hypothetical protein KA257_01670 [Opitutaceae bacterium]|nr:hypothetical protein [Opitutaceae bacterium]MBP9912646.1 hypothetical protein [Opitutaceae bacterium]
MSAPEIEKEAAAARTEFWRATRERLAREPMEAQVEPVLAPLPYKKCALTLRRLDGVPRFL